MNRRILEDVKIKHNNIGETIPTPKVISKPVVSVENHNPTSNVKKDDSSKYEFLNRRSRIQSGQSSAFSRIPQTPQMPSKKKSIRGFLLFLFILSLLVGAFYLLSTVFLHANITIEAKSKTFDLKHQKFVASKNSSGIPFELMIVSDKDYKDVVLTNSKEASEKAKGEVVLYNEYSTKSQKISAGSFLSDEKGKTYKTDSTVTIPGYTLDKTKKIIPGQVSVGVTSFLPGEVYNGAPSSFSINAFKGTEKYKKIYGKLKTELSGGMTGLVYVMSEEDKSQVNNQSSSSKEKLLRKLEAQVPGGYILYPNAVNFSYESNGDIVSKTPDVRIEMNGTVSAFLIKESDLSNALIKKLLPEISDKEKSEIIEPKLSDLSLNFINPSQDISKEVDSFEFELNGSTTLEWNPDGESLKPLLVSKNKEEVTPIFKEDPGILSAKVKIVPFWSKFLPKDIENINIIIK